MRLFDRYPTIFVTIGAAIAAAIALNFSEISLSGLGVQDLSTKFLSLAFMALVIERAVEIYVKNRFSAEEATLKQGVQMAAYSVKLYREALQAAASAVVPAIGSDAESTVAINAKYGHIEDLQSKLEKSRAALLKEKNAAHPQLQDLSGRKKRAATIAALLLSLAIAIVGIRVLAQLIPPETAQTLATANVNAVTNGMYQAQAFGAVDILLTALLLSGGADGVHHLVKGFLSNRNDLLETP